MYLSNKKNVFSIQNIAVKSLQIHVERSNEYLEIKRQASVLFLKQCGFLKICKWGCDSNDKNGGCGSRKITVVSTISQRLIVETLSRIIAHEGAFKLFTPKSPPAQTTHSDIIRRLDSTFSCHFTSGMIEVGAERGQSLILAQSRTQKRSCRVTFCALRR